MSDTAPLARDASEQRLREIPAETLDELRWLANSQFAIAIVDKPVLKVLLDAYERQHARER